MRYKVQNVISIENNVTIYDSESIDWNTFTWENGYFKHILKQEEVLKFYMVSYQYYDTVEYEDVILLLNNIANSFDLVRGSIIKIPKKKDIDDFITGNLK